MHQALRVFIDTVVSNTSRVMCFLDSTLSDVSSVVNIFTKTTRQMNRHLWLKAQIDKNNHLPLDLSIWSSGRIINARPSFRATEADCRTRESVRLCWNNDNCITCDYLLPTVRKHHSTRSGVERKVWLLVKRRFHLNDSIAKICGVWTSAGSLEGPKS